MGFFIASLGLEVKVMTGQEQGMVLELPLLPLRGVLVFPDMVVPLQVGREKSVSALNEAMKGERLIALSTQREMRVDDPSPGDIYEIGVVARIKKMARSSDGTLKVVFEGQYRCQILDYVQHEPHFRVQVRAIPEPRVRTPRTEALMGTLVHQYEKYVKLSKKVPSEALVTVINIDEPGRLADMIAAYLLIKPEDKQEILETFSLDERLERVTGILRREMELLELEKRINVRVRKQMEKAQKEYYLREQMKAIQKELGERDDQASEGEEYRAKIKEKDLPEEVAEKALAEVERLEKMPPMAAEAVVVRSYLDWLLALPWKEETQDRLDIEEAERILDEDHYGLKKVKERILEYLAVRQIAEQIKGPILCLVGPPGVGKTSLAKSVARAMGRKFVRVSLGGVRDEAEIRGHRRTYVGSMPGRIIQGMKQAGTRNPVFLLDEIDKLSSDFRGDPASALLEALDPEQNQSFSDHYIELSYDLSRVMFITTANVTATIPRPLLDRMEVITLPGYTEEEKVAIARRHLIPKQLKEHGLDPDTLSISENALRTIIRRYTREAGVRNVEREIASICRKAAKAVVKDGRKKVRVTTQNLPSFLGQPRYRYGTAESREEVGVAMGLGWTETGGDVMPIEVTVMPGSGKLLLTGKLGEVMQESGQAAMSYVRSKAARFGVDGGFYQKTDIHVHVPEGAIPKDGPSAGITMACALVSTLTQRPVRNDVAMTGEITLRGKVLPIGGVKEKVLAAHRAGITTLILPLENEKDLEDVPANVRRQMEFVFVESMEEVLEVALVGGLPEEAATAKGVLVSSALPEESTRTAVQPTSIA